MLELYSRVHQMLEELCQFCTVTSDQFRWGGSKSAHQEFILFIAKFQECCQLLESQKELTALIEQKQQLQLCDLLGDMTTAYAKNDLVLVADLLQYDLFSLLIKILHQVQNKIVDVQKPESLKNAEDTIY